MGLVILVTPIKLILLAEFRNGMNYLDCAFCRSIVMDCLREWAKVRKETADLLRYILFFLLFVLIFNGKLYYLL